MTSYGHGYYTYMRKQKVRAGTRAILALMCIGKVDFEYATKQHFNYLSFKYRMIGWRKTMRSKALLKKAYGGKIT